MSPIDSYKYNKNSMHLGLIIILFITSREFLLLGQKMNMLYKLVPTCSITIDMQSFNILSPAATRRGHRNSGVRMSVTCDFVDATFSETAQWILFKYCRIVSRHMWLIILRHFDSTNFTVMGLLPLT